MKKIFALYLILSTAHCLGKEVQATALWKSETTDFQSDKPVRTILVMSIKNGWHTYWKNPGEGGLPPEITVDLPEGWSLGEIYYPVPKRFMTGELAGFGYEGEIRFPLTLTPPVGKKGTLPVLKAKLTWLVCNDDSCLPGKADLVLTATTSPEEVAQAYEALPDPIPGASLTLTMNGENVEMSLTLPADLPEDPSKWEIFPTTRNIIHPAAKIIFKKDNKKPDTWMSICPKSEYLDGKPKAIELVASGGRNSYLLSSK